MSPYMLVHGDTGEVDERGNPIRIRAIWDASAIEVAGTYTLRLNTRVPQIALPQHLQHGALSILDPAEDGVFGPGSNGRSEERRVGKECVSTCRSRWSPYH